MGRDGSPITREQRHRGGGGPNSWSSRSGRSGRDPPSSIERSTPTAVLALSVLILTCITDASVAFRNPPLPGRASPATTWNRRNGSFQKLKPLLTSLSYKSNSENQDVSLQSPKQSSVRFSKKRYKARSRTTPNPRSYRGVPATEEELAHHLQSVFSDHWLVAEEEEDGDESDTCILSEPGDEEGDAPSSHSAMQRQMDSCRKLDRHPALALNADYQPLRMLPLSIWSWQDSIKAVLSGKAVVVDIYPKVFVRTVSLEMPVPSVIALLEYAPTGNAKPAFTRRNVFLRDGYRCQYCSKPFRTSELSLDHVIPRSVGGKLTWENTVTCCNRCNSRKGCLRPSDLHRVGMKLQSRPRCPSLYELAAGSYKFVPRRVHPTWAPFLGFAAVDE